MTNISNMIYIINTTSNYTACYFKDSVSGKKPAKEFLFNLPKKHRAKLFRLITYLCEQRGYLTEPYSRHIRSGIRELRVNFGKTKYRIFYSLLPNKKIILLSGFIKKGRKTPRSEIQKASCYFQDAILNQNIYE